MVSFLITEWYRPLLGGLENRVVVEQVVRLFVGLQAVILPVIGSKSSVPEGSAQANRPCPRFVCQTNISGRFDIKHY